MGGATEEHTTNRPLPITPCSGASFPTESSASSSSSAALPTGEGIWKLGPYEFPPDVRTCDSGGWYSVVMVVVAEFVVVFLRRNATSSCKGESV